MYAHTALIDQLSRNTGAAGMYRDYLVLAEIVRQRFPADSPLAKALDSLRERIAALPTAEAAPAQGESSPPVDDAKHQALRKDLNAFAEAAKQLISTGATLGPEQLLEGERRKIVGMANDAFYDSGLFTAGKWILAMSLGLIGVGSVGYAGFNVLAWDRLQEAQQKLSQTTEGFNTTIKQIDLQRGQLVDAQNAALKQLHAAIESQSGTVQKEFQNELSIAKAARASQAEDATKFIEARKRKLDERIDAAIEQAKTEVDAFGVEQMSVIATAARTGSHSIDMEAQSQKGELGLRTSNVVRGLEQEGDQKRSDIDTAAANNITALNQTFTVSLNDLNTESTSAKGKIGAIVSQTGVRAAQFEDDMNIRLASWDRKFTAQQETVDELTNSAKGLRSELGDLAGKLSKLQTDPTTALESSAGELRSKLNDLEGRMGALQQSSSSALEIAGKLSAGTTSDQLSLIGSVLEKSSLVIAAGVILGVISLLVSIWARMTAGARRPPAE